MASVAWILAVATGWMADVMMVSDDVTAQELASADGQSLAVGNALASASPTSINTTMTDVLSIKIIMNRGFWSSHSLLNIRDKSIPVKPRRHNDCCRQYG